MFINLTPHDVNIVDEKGNIFLVIPRSGEQARCAVKNSPAGEFAGIPLVLTSLGDVSGLPAPRVGIMYIVSLPVRQAVPGRTDVASPGDMVRGADGQPIGCRNLSVNP